METPDTYWDLFFGYGAIWLLIVFFLFRLQRAQAKLSSRLEELDADSSQTQKVA